MNGQPSARSPSSGAEGAGPGLYVHVPFCSAICPYCDFAVRVGSASERESFVDLLLAEAEQWRGVSSWPGAPAPFDTVYLGGGTPSALPPSELGRLLEGLRDRLPIAPDCWLGIEVNPEDVSIDAVAGWRRLEVDFLSLGLQALDDDALRRLGRRHRERQARESLAIALTAGIPVVSVDLIYALCESDRERWQATLAQIVEQAPEHLSCYELTFHEGTPFGRALANGRMIETSHGERAGLFELTHETLAAAGYQGYEASNFARRWEARSRHNQKYWRHVPYLGLGPSAHSFDGRRRWWNVRDHASYRSRLQEAVSPIADSELLSASALALETLMLGLRTADGVDLGLLERHLSSDLPESWGRAVQRLADAGFLRSEAGRLRPTLAGLAVAERLAVELAADL